MIWEHLKSKGIFIGIKVVVFFLVFVLLHLTGAAGIKLATSWLQNGISKPIAAAASDQMCITAYCMADVVCRALGLHTFGSLWCSDVKSKSTNTTIWKYSTTSPAFKTSSKYQQTWLKVKKVKNVPCQCLLIDIMLWGLKQCIIFYEIPKKSTFH